MSVVVAFSCPHQLGCAGPSRPLTRIHEALRREWGSAYGGEGYKVVVPEQFAELTELNRLGDTIGPAFDDLAAEYLRRELKWGEPKVLLAGGGASLRTGRFVKANDKGRIGTLWFSSWHGYAQRVLAEEYAKHGVKASPIHPYVAWRARKEQEESDFIIVPSEHCKSTYPVELQERIRVAEFGVDATEFHPSTPQDFGAKRFDGPLRVLFPATNPIRKGLGYVLEAFKKMDPEKFVLTVTGGWQVEGAGPDGCLRTPGWVDDQEMRRLMQENHVLLLPSLEEGQGLASLEGAASGMALVLTPNVGLPIVDGEQGRVVPPRDPLAIRSALVEFEKDRGALERMSKAARAFAEARPWEKFERRIVDIVKEEESK